MDLLFRWRPERESLGRRWRRRYWRCQPIGRRQLLGRHWSAGHRNTTPLDPSEIFVSRASILFISLFLLLLLLLFLFVFFSCRLDFLASPSPPPAFHSIDSIVKLSMVKGHFTLDLCQSPDKISEKTRNKNGFFFRYKSERRSRPLPFLRSDAAAAGRIPASLIGRFGRRHSVDSGMSSFPFQTPPPQKKKTAERKKIRLNQPMTLMSQLPS